MCKRQIAISLALLLCSCSPIEKKFFDFPICTTYFPEEAVAISPKMMSEKEFPLSNFQVLDSAIVSYDAVRGYGLTVTSMNSGDTLVNLCRKGRGADEMLLLVPYYDIVDGVAGLVDPMSSRYMEVNISESIKAGKTVVARTLQLGASGTSFYENVRRVGTDKLLCYDTKTNVQERTLADVPRFILYDLTDGKLISEYKIARESLLKYKPKSFLPLNALLLFKECRVPGTNEICCGFFHIPMIVFFDFENGSFRGVRVDGVPKFSKNFARYYFGTVEAYGNHIYVLYSGALFDDQEKSVNHCILKLDLDGNILTRYELDGDYTHFVIDKDVMYLCKRMGNHIYTINMNIFEI